MHLHAKGSDWDQAVRLDVHVCRATTATRCTSCQSSEPISSQHAHGQSNLRRVVTLIGSPWRMYYANSVDSSDVDLAVQIYINSITLTSAVAQAVILIKFMGDVAVFPARLKAFSLLSLCSYMISALLLFAVNNTSYNPAFCMSCIFRCIGHIGKWGSYTLRIWDLSSRNKAVLAFGSRCNYSPPTPFSGTARSPSTPSAPPPRSRSNPALSISSSSPGPSKSPPTSFTAATCGAFARDLRMADRQTTESAVAFTPHSFLNADPRLPSVVGERKLVKDEKADTEVVRSAEA
ncbi:hypothetical protein M427DRAFT_35803 [Gonapodya prolifera JEL478]|uniref:Uncharacterized protein n=1 Tax=Gonapodya prolifera (strain JEL478) TaxID=1344416 RepID=A0A139A4V4_GONPJ|nr:hypothetical protein M427DRAFT_35803 [Gonapodya prolifera JEL478]|eukprot:KXS11423.1 hypothetical protein M427DRAFT_35803 [Gonapodya prolifera JEL478]